MKVSKSLRISFLWVYRAVFLLGVVFLGRIEASEKDLGWYSVASVKSTGLVQDESLERHGVILVKRVKEETFAVKFPKEPTYRTENEKFIAECRLGNQLFSLIVQPILEGCEHVTDSPEVLRGIDGVSSFQRTIHSGKNCYSFTAFSQGGEMVEVEKIAASLRYLA